MTSQDNKDLHNGAYSIQHKMLEQERLKRWHDEHYQATISMRSRAQMFSKQTVQRKKALEQKKMAMARAEEERRKQALEERRKIQQEATDRFRSAIYRNFRSPSTGKPTKHYHNSSNETSVRASKSEHRNRLHSSAAIGGGGGGKEDRIILGATVELTSHHQTSTPTLDEVLDTIRNTRENSRTTLSFNTSDTSFEETKRSPLSIQTQPFFTVDDHQTTPTTKILFPVHTHPNHHSPEDTPIRHDTPPADPLEESTISSTSSSLHDSLDTPPKSPSPEPIAVATLLEVTPLKASDTTTKTRDTSSSPLPEATPMQEEKKIVGILKKPSEIVQEVISSTTFSSSVSTLVSRAGSKTSASGTGSAGKRVRFVDELHRSRGNKATPPKMITTDGFLLPSSTSGGPVASKMRISLGGHSPRGKNRGHKNGMVPVPHPPLQEPEEHAHSPTRPISPQLLTLPVDKTVVLDQTPTDEEINTLWRHINAYLHHTKSSAEDVMLSRESSAPQLSREMRCRNSHHPVKLWRRHAIQQQQEEHNKQATAVTGPRLSVEEHRLMESIEVLNEKLKGRVVVTGDNVDYVDIKRTGSSRSLSELPKTRVRHHPKTIIQTTPTTRQYLQHR